MPNQLPLETQLMMGLRQTWEIIAADCLAAKEDCDGLEAGSATMDREEVIDVVIDQVDNQGCMSGETKQAWDALSFKEKQTFARKCFAYSRYGW